MRDISKYLVVLSIFVVSFVAFLLANYFTNKPSIAASATKTLTSQADWEAGTLVSLDTTTTPGSMEIDTTSGMIEGGTWETDGVGDTDDVHDETELGDGVIISSDPTWDGIHEYVVRYFGYDVCIDRVRWWHTGSSSFETHYYSGAVPWSYTNHITEDEILMQRSLIAGWSTIEPDPGWGGVKTAQNVWIDFDTAAEYQANTVIWAIHSPYILESTDLREFQIYGISGGGVHTTGSTQIDGTMDLTSWDTFAPTQTTPANTTIKYQFRTSADASNWSSWTAAQEYSGTPLDLSGLAAERYLQVKSTLSSNICGNSPIIDSFSVNYTTTLCENFDHLNISPSSATLTSGGTTNIIATPVDAGGSSLPNVSVSYSTSCGSITATGAYTAPTVTQQTTCTVTATSDCGGSATSTITVNSPDPPPPPPICNYNGIQDNGETGVDCGGGGCPDCPDCQDLITVFYSPGDIYPAAESNNEYYLYLSDEEVEAWQNQELNLNIKAAAVDYETYQDYADDGIYKLDSDYPPGIVRDIDPTTYTIDPEALGSFSEDNLLNIDYNIYPTAYDFNVLANSPICSIEATLHVISDGPINCPNPPCNSGIILDQPNGGETYFIGTIEEILWHYLNIEPIVNSIGLELSLDSGESYTYTIGRTTKDTTDRTNEFKETKTEDQEGSTIDNRLKSNPDGPFNRNPGLDTEDSSNDDTTNQTTNSYNQSSNIFNNSTNAVAADFSAPINFFWDIPMDDNLLTKTAKVKVIAYDKLGRAIATDTSDDDFEIKKSLFASVISNIGKYIDIISKSLLTLAALSAILQFLSPLLNIIRALLASGKKKITSLGTVYSATSGEPQAGTTVLLFDAKTKRLLKTDLTDEDGQFNFVLTPGKYFMKIKDKELAIASNLSDIAKKSLYYTDNYFGEIFEIKDMDQEAGRMENGEKNLNTRAETQTNMASTRNSSVLNSNTHAQDINLNQITENEAGSLNYRDKQQDPSYSLRMSNSNPPNSSPPPSNNETQTRYNIPTLAKEGEKYKSLALLNIKNNLLKLLIYLDWPLLIFGTIFSILAIIKNPDIINILILIAYLFLWARHSITRPIGRSFGVVIDEDTKKPVSLAIVRALDYDTKKLVQTSVTNRAGHFTFNLPKGYYLLTVQKFGYMCLDPIEMEVDAGNKSVNNNIYLKELGKEEIFGLPKKLHNQRMPEHEIIKGRKINSVNEIIQNYGREIGK